jgi:hypothetical protein
MMLLHQVDGKRLANCLWKNFIQDELEPNKFELYDPNTGDIKPAKKVDCIGLERAAVWEAGHVEERIVDHFAGRTNKWVEDMRIK